VPFNGWIISGGHLPGGREIHVDDNVTDLVYGILMPFEVEVAMDKELQDELTVEDIRSWIPPR
jgi:hypothetical protein